MHPWKINAAPGGTGEERRRALAGYFTAIQEMDRNIGRVFETLEERGFSDNTLVVFTSDNGMNMGHHGIWGKGNGTFPQNMYDTSVKVPTLAWWPGRTPAGRIEDRLLSHYDIMPTLLELAGVENPEADELPGSSFAEVLTGAAGAAAERAPGAGRADGAVVVFDEYGPTRMIRTREWKYVHRYPYGPHELYNLAEDPGERRNLVREAAHRERVVELRGRLDSWFVRYADPRQEGTREAVTGKGQIDLVGPAAEGRTSFVPEFTPETEDGDKPMTYHSPFRKDV
jgi:arylsulfatase A-like enzyme